MQKGLTPFCKRDRTLLHENYREIQDYVDNVYTIKPTEKANENQEKEMIDCKSNEIRNIIQWAANGTKKREKEKPEVDGDDKIFMISNGVEEEKE